MREVEQIKMKTHWHIFLAFFRIGIFGFGGGPSMIPLFHKEIVERYGWMSEEEFADVLAIGNTLPGPIATKMSGYIGYRVAGTSGCINAVLAIVIPSVIGMILFLTILSNHKDQSWVKGMGQGVVPVVFVMMAMLTWDFSNKSVKTLGWAGALGIGAASLVAIVYFGLHPGLVISVLLAVALLRKNPAKPEPGKPDKPDSDSKESNKQESAS